MDQLETVRKATQKPFLTQFLFKSFKMGPWYYHYTNKESLDRILKSGYIKSSTDTTQDCALGKGVYLTTLNPKRHNKEVIAKNNYEGAWKRGLANGKTDSFIQICIPNDTVKLTKETDRQTLLSIT